MSDTSQILSPADERVIRDAVFLAVLGPERLKAIHQEEAAKSPAQVRAAALEYLPNLTAGLWALAGHEVADAVELAVLAGTLQSPHAVGKDYNPDQPRVPAGSPGGGQWVGDNQRLPPGTRGHREKWGGAVIHGFQERARRAAAQTPEADAIRAGYDEARTNFVEAVAGALRRVPGIADAMNGPNPDALAGRAAQAAALQQRQARREEFQDYMRRALRWMIQNATAEDTSRPLAGTPPPQSPYPHFPTRAQVAAPAWLPEEDRATLAADLTSHRQWRTLEMALHENNLRISRAGDRLDHNRTLNAIQPTPQGIPAPPVRGTGGSFVVP